MSTLSKVQQWLADALGVQSDFKPPTITAETSITLAAVWYAVNKIAGDIAALPLEPYTRDGRNREPADDHPAYRLTKYESNPLQTADVFKQLLQTHALLWGNGRAYVRRNNRGEPIELIPLPPTAKTYLIDGEKVHCVRVDNDHRLTTVASLDFDSEGVVMLEDKDVLHVMGLSFDGIAGLSVVAAARRSLTIGGAADARAAKQMVKGFTGRVMITAPQGALRKPADAKEFLEDFRKQFAADDEAEVAGLLREGAGIEALNMSNDDMQFLESRSFQRQEVMQWFGLESMPGDKDSVSYNSLTQKQQAYLQGPLSYWCERWKMACNKSLLRPEQKRQATHYFHFNTAAKLRGTAKERFEVYTLGRQIGVFSANDVRALEDMNPIAGGDTYENPNITPGDPATRDDGNGNGNTETDEGSAETSDAQNLNQSSTPGANNRAALLMLENLIGVECNKAVNAAGSRNFLNWMDKFYPKWETKLADAIENIGGDRDLATQHCEESKRQLLDVAGSADNETLGEKIQTCVADWSARAQIIINEMELCHV